MPRATKVRTMPSRGAEARKPVADTLTEVNRSRLAVVVPQDVIELVRT